MGMTRPDTSGMFIGRVTAVNEELGTISCTMLNFAGGILENVPLKMPAAGVDWGIACLPLEGDMVEIDWTPDGDPYAQATIPFRYWDWIGQSGIKRLRKGELFFRGTGGGVGLLSAMGSVLWRDSVGSLLKLDPVQELATLVGKGTAQITGGSSLTSIGNVLRFITDLETGLPTLQAVGLPKVPGTLPAQEYRQQVVPSQVTFVGAPLSLIDLRRGDVYDNAGNRVQKSPLVLASEQRIDKTIGFQYRKETYYNDGSFAKEFGTAAPMIFGQEWDGISENTWTMTPVGLSKLELLKLVVDAVNPLILAALQGGSVQRLVDERILPVINDLCLQMATHSHTGTAGVAPVALPVTTLPPTGITIGGAIAPLFATLVTGEIPQIPLGVAIPVTTVATRAQ